jgi:1-deoxy-D-xylulose-5-phosphate synthase
VERSSDLRSIPIGKGEVLKEGEDLLILAIGSTVVPSVRAADRLEKAGIQTTVINSRFLKPLDGDLICHWARKTGRLLTVEENVLQGGFGSAVLELLQERRLSAIEVKRLGLPDSFIEHGPQSILRAKYGIDEDGIFKKALEMVEGRQLSSLPSSQTQTSVPPIPPYPE